MSVLNEISCPSVNIDQISTFEQGLSSVATPATPRARIKTLGVSRMQGIRELTKREHSWIVQDFERHLECLKGPKRLVTNLIKGWIDDELLRG